MFLQIIYVYYNFHVLYSLILLSDVTPDEIRNHDKWYTKYLDLKSKRKEMIEKWRKSKSL